MESDKITEQRMIIVKFLIILLCFFQCFPEILLPAQNAHTHSGMTLLRSYADDLPLHDWLTKQIFPIEARMDAFLSIILTICSFIHPGRET